MDILNNNTSADTKALSRSEYLRHLFFGSLLPLAMLVASGVGLLNIPTAIYFILSTVLYPYSRFIYEQIVGFIVGDNILLVDGIVFIPAKAVTISICWFLAVFVAPFYFLFYVLKPKLKSEDEDED